MGDITPKSKTEAAVMLTAYAATCAVRAVLQPFRLAKWKAKGGKRHGPRPEIRP
jgi:hypothetical protein